MTTSPTTGGLTRLSSDLDALLILSRSAVPSDARVDRDRAAIVIELPVRVAVDSVRAGIPGAPQLRSLIHSLRAGGTDVSVEIGRLDVDRHGVRVLELLVRSRHDRPCEQQNAAKALPPEHPRAARWLRGCPD
jgi:hypothetical protein